MTFKKLTITLSLIICSLANAQKLELGKVTIAELEQKRHQKDTSAVAAILFQKGEVRYEYSQDKGFEIKTEVFTKIKIYKKEGYSWATNAVKYYIYGNGKEVVVFDDAVTYNLVNGKIEKSKLKSDGEFIEKTNKYWNIKKITMPNVKVGSVIEFSYIITSPFQSELKDWIFQYNIPVNQSEFKTFIPEYFTYNPSQKGFLFPKVTTEKLERSVNYVYTEENAAQRVGGTGIPQRSNETLKFTETVTDYFIKDVPALKDEDFVNNIANYTAAITHELAIIQYPNQAAKNFATNWENVIKKINGSDDFGEELNKNGYFEADLKQVLNSVDDNYQKIAAIFSFVKQKVKWNDFVGYSCNDGIKKAYKEGVGNVAEINLMLTAMLRFAGFDANPIILSTRSNGIALFPSRTAFNYVISGVSIANELFLLDATEKYAVPNILPNRDLNWFGRMIKKDGTSEQVELMPKISSSTNNILNFKIISNNNVEGSLKRQFTNYNAFNFRNKYSGFGTESYIENYENKNNNIEINDYVRNNEYEIAKPIVESFNFKDSRSLEIINKKIYVSPLLFLTEKENPFKQDIREYPMDFGFPTNEQFTINIEIPDGYIIESMPKSINITSGDNISFFKYSITSEENNINILITSSLNEAIVPSDYYDILKDFYRQVIEKQNEKIVLIKK